MGAQNGGPALRDAPLFFLELFQRSNEALRPFALVLLLCGVTLCIESVSSPSPRDSTPRPPVPNAASLEWRPLLLRLLLQLLLLAALSSATTVVMDGSTAMLVGGGEEITADTPHTRAEHTAPVSYTRMHVCPLMVGVIWCRVLAGGAGSALLPHGAQLFFFFLMLCCPAHTAPAVIMTSQPCCGGDAGATRLQRQCSAAVLKGATVAHLEPGSQGRRRRALFRVRVCCDAAFTQADVCLFCVSCRVDRSLQRVLAAHTTQAERCAEVKRLGAQAMQAHQAQRC